jgi:hypothetical protein
MVVSLRPNAAEVNRTLGGIVLLPGARIHGETDTIPVDHLPGGVEEKSYSMDYRTQQGEICGQKSCAMVSICPGRCILFHLSAIGSTGSRDGACRVVSVHGP